MISRYIKKGGKLWIRIFPDKPLTFRAAETRMGSGKGNVEFWVAIIKPGKVLYEIETLSRSVAISALTTASFKISVKTRLIAKFI